MQIRRKKKFQAKFPSKVAFMLSYLILSMMIIFYYQSQVRHLNTLLQNNAATNNHDVINYADSTEAKKISSLPKTGNLLPSISSPNILFNRDSESYMNDDAKALQTQMPSISVPKLRILASISTTGLLHMQHVEQQIDAFRDVCEAGARIDVHLYTDILYTYPEVEQLSGRTGCRNEAGAFTLTIHLRSPSWKFKFMDFHRQLFKENIDQYDLFIQNEDDHLIRLSHMIAFLQETELLRQLVGTKRLSDYSIGFVRYENKHDGRRSHRVSIDHGFDEDHIQLEIVDHPNIEGRYWRTPGFGMKYNYQGFYMATPELLKAWDVRPNCQFLHYPPKDFGPLHREFVNSGFLYHKAYCGVTQLIPIETMEDFNVWHMSQNKYYDNSQSTTTPLLKVYSAARESIDVSSEHENLKIFDGEIDAEKRADIAWDVDLYNTFIENLN